MNILGFIYLFFCRFRLIPIFPLASTIVADSLVHAPRCVRDPLTWDGTFTVYLQREAAIGTRGCHVAPPNHCLNMHPFGTCMA